MRNFIVFMCMSLLLTAFVGCLGETRPQTPKVTLIKKSGDTLTYCIETHGSLTLSQVEGLIGHSQHSIINFKTGGIKYPEFKYAEVVLHTEGDLDAPCKSHVWQSQDRAVIITYMRCGENHTMKWFFSELDWREDALQANKVPNIIINDIFLKGESVVYETLYENKKEEQ